DGRYVLLVTASDLAQNTAQQNFVLTVDNTPPQVALTAPASDALLGGRTPQTPVRGTIVEANLSSWTLRFGVGSDPTTWTTIATQTTVPAGDVLTTWDV